MPTSGGEFDPSDPKYEKTDDLPKEQQKKYVDVDGGFVTKEAAEIERTYAEAAAEENKKIPFYKRPFLKENEKATARDMILDELTDNLKNIKGRYYAGYLRDYLGVDESNIGKKAEYLNSLDSTTRRQTVESLVRSELRKREEELGYPIPDDFHVQLHKENFNHRSRFRMYPGDEISGTFNGHKLVLKRGLGFNYLSDLPAMDFYKQRLFDENKDKNVPKVGYFSTEECIIGSIDGNPLTSEEAWRLWEKYYGVAHDSLLDINKITENVLEILHSIRRWNAKEIESRTLRVGVKKALEDL